MMAPGRRVHALATRWYSERARRRLIDPAMADLQAEYAAARRTGSHAHVFGALVAGYLAMAKVLVIAGCGDLGAGIVTWQPEERAGARAGAWVALIVVSVLTALFVSLPLARLDASLWLSIYLIPQALPLSVPFGLAVAVASMLRGAALTRKLAAAVLVAGALASVGMFANFSWLIPESNQRFREMVWAQLDPHPNPSTPLGRGLNELGWSDARKRLREMRARADTGELRRSETTYYRRFAMSVTPMVIVGLIVAIAFRRAWTRAGLTSVALFLCASHYALQSSTWTLVDITIVPPIVLVWTPDAICGLAALLLACGSRSVPTAPPAPTR